MDKKGKANIGILLAVIAVIAVASYFLISQGIAGGKPLSEHAKPVDISTSQEGQGMEVNFYEKVDGEWVPVNIPDWFKVVQTSGIVGAIVAHPPSPSCSVRTDCPGATTNTKIDCWNQKCVLTNIDGMSINVKVTNGATFDFNDVYISSATPVGFSNALPTGITNKKQLPAGGTVSWDSSIMDLDTLGWIGTQQTFSVVAKGTNSYNGQVQQSSDSITLEFNPDPSGTFSVAISAGI